MIVKKTTLKFDPSTSPDVRGYLLYVAESPGEVDYLCESFDLGDRSEIDISSLQGISTKDGVYNIGIAAYDDAGNLSSMLKMQDVALDFKAPDPPLNLRIVRDMPTQEPDPTPDPDPDPLP